MPLTAISSNKNIKVFIADDSLIVREHLVTMLDELPRIVIVGQAENVAEAINGILELQPDVVILDIRMPGGSGIDVLQNACRPEPTSFWISQLNLTKCQNC
jgi:DNA-binding NarL/FixJ family response regulator